MPRIILILLLASMSDSVMAKWVEVNKSTDMDVTTYANPASIHRNGNMVKMWVLIDHKTVQNSSDDKYLSIRSKNVYDCKENKLKHLEALFYSGNMGRGSVVLSGTNTGDWYSVSPGSIDDEPWKYACAKK